MDDGFALIELQGDFGANGTNSKQNSFHLFATEFTAGIKQNGLIMNGALSSSIHSVNLFGMELRDFSFPSAFLEIDV